MKNIFFGKRKYKKTILVLFLIAITFLGFCFYKKQTSIFYAKLIRWSTSGETKFKRYDFKNKEVMDSDNQYAWFWAMPKDVPDNLELTNKWIEFIRKNQGSVFKIVGKKNSDDCEYYGQNHCIENINIKMIEVVGKNASMEF